jgi:PiT family inorganic phosphate transporter
MEPILAVLVAVIALALIFDFINGFHDSANSIATVVATRVLTPLQAVCMAAFFNFVSFLVFPLAVADTVAKTVDKSLIDNALISAALIGASGWNLITWHYGLPSSSSHALLGGLVGAALTKWAIVSGSADTFSAAVSWGSVGFTALFIVLAPVIGLLLGGSIALMLTWFIHSRAAMLLGGPLLGGGLFALTWFSLDDAARHAPWEMHLGTGHRLNLVLSPVVWAGVAGTALAAAIIWMFSDPRPRRIKTVFRAGQIFSAAFYSLGHGGNDAQKTMGIIIALLLTVPAFDKIGKDGKPVLDKDGKPVKVAAISKAKLDADGRPVIKKDKAGNPVPKKDKEGNPVLKDGKPVYETAELSPDEYVPLWVVLSCHAAMGLGTLMGGWKIVKTMGKKLIHLRPVDGFCAEFGAAVTLVLTASPLLKVPVSTTQTITGSIVGVGAVNSIGGVKWQVFERIIYAWILTIPGAMLIAALSWVALSRVM